MRGASGPFGDGGVVGQAFNSGARGLSMRIENQIEMKALRRLHGAQRGAGRRRDDQFVFTDLLDRIVEAGPRSRGPIARGGGDGPPDQRLRRESAGAIMDQHEVWRQWLRRLRLQARQDAGLTRRPAECRRSQPFCAIGGRARRPSLVELAVIGMDNDGRCEKLMGRAQSASGVWQSSGRPAQSRYCLGSSPPSARAPSRRHHDQRNLGGFDKSASSGNRATLCRVSTPARQP